jgi:hypothetical protein
VNHSSPTVQIQTGVTHDLKLVEFLRGYGHSPENQFVIRGVRILPVIVHKEKSALSARERT